jgi:hypothetical protein
MTQLALSKPIDTTQPMRRRFTLQEYQWLVQQGFFGDDRVELIDGEIVRMAPTGPEHSLSNEVTHCAGVWCLCGYRASHTIVRIHDPLTLSATTSPFRTWR